MNSYSCIHFKDISNTYTYSVFTFIPSSLHPAPLTPASLHPSTPGPRRRVTHRPGLPLPSPAGPRQPIPAQTFRSYVCKWGAWVVCVHATVPAPCAPAVRKTKCCALRTRAPPTSWNTTVFHRIHSGLCICCGIRVFHSHFPEFIN